MNVYEVYPRFSALFAGLTTAFGTGKGQWIKRPPTALDWCRHLEGHGHGIGIAPLRPDNTVMFAAIDLDEPDFDAAREMQDYIPGASYIERSRSGNAHVWVFFSAPMEAWVPMGILRDACVAAGKEHVEVFPKNHDFSRVTLGNYINLPYHGSKRPVLWHAAASNETTYTVENFLSDAKRTRNDPADWHARARWLQLGPPKPREDQAEFGAQRHLHMCAERLIEGGGPPLVEGHRSAVFFAIAKQLANCALYDEDETLQLMRGYNAESEPPEDDAEIRRILRNAYEKRYTSTGCDDPLFAPYAHPDCPIANPRR